MTSGKKLVLSLLAGLILLTTLAWLGYRSIHVGQESMENSISAIQCQPSALANTQYPGMVWIPGETFIMGSDATYYEEGPAHEVTIPGFWISQHEVTNTEFKAFVDATGYVTLAERGIEHPETGEGIPGSAVFAPHIPGYEPSPFQSWWQFMEEANWQQPEGPGSNLEGRENHPVVHIAYEDALAYADWKGHALPTEAQFELAAGNSAMSNEAGEFTSNTWQGLFPLQHDTKDGFTGTAPVACFPANEYGLHDMIGNVWEWTQSPYYEGHTFPAARDYPEGLDPRQPGEPVAVIKGGSYLCAPNYCMRYRPAARQAQSKGLGTSHIGFRTVINSTKAR